VGTPYLYTAPRDWAERFQLKALTDKINDLIEAAETSSRRNEQHDSRFEAILGSLAEAVFIANASNKIILANSAAKTLLNLRPDYQGLRLESVITGHDFLEYLELLRAGKDPGRKSLEIIQGKQTLYFELIGSFIQTDAPDDEPMTMFVLHDVTRTRQLENIRQEFVANVSHELRTPVTIIKGFSESLSEDYKKLQPSDHEYFIGKIHRNACRLHALLEDLISLSQLESPAHELMPEPVLINRLLEDFLEDIGPRAEQCSLTLKSEVEPSLGLGLFDSIKLTQVLHNLCDNVFRYARGATELVLTCRHISGRLLLSVSDDGCGIAPADREHIFERFYRVDKGRSRELGGTGLGLSIVKHIAQLHGGTVRAGESPSGGTLIALDLPLQRPLAQANRHAAANAYAITPSPFVASPAAARPTEAPARSPLGE
jgi:signal transduction histidine kinase